MKTALIKDSGWRNFVIIYLNLFLSP